MTDLQASLRAKAESTLQHALASYPAREGRRYRAQVRAEGLPAVQPIGMVTGRQAPNAEPLAAVLISRYLDFSLPYRYLFTQERRVGWE